MAVDPDGLIPLTEKPFKGPVMDVVFVHGLAGGAFSTWRHDDSQAAKSFSWPHQYCDALPECAVWTFGYAAGFTNLGNPGMIIKQRAGNFAAQMLQAGLGKRPLVFITHSMGGLVVKALITAGPLSSLAGLTGLISQIRGVVFCGTPHRGSEFAAAAGKLGRYFSPAGALVAGLVGWTIGDIIGRMLGTQPHVREMEAGSPALDLLHDEFLEWCRRNPAVKFASYAECAGLWRKSWPRRTLQLGLIVPRASANPGVGSITDVDADHISLVKPHPGNKAVHSLVYDGTTEFVRSLLPCTSGSSQTNQDTSLRDLVREEIRAALAELLISSPPPTTV